MTKKKDLTAEELRWSQVEKNIQSEKYANQVYGKDSQVTIPGILFAEIMQRNYQQQKVLDDISKILKNISGDIDTITAAGDMFSLKLAEQHMEFVDKGLTRKLEENAGDNSEGDNAGN